MVVGFPALPWRRGTSLRGGFAATFVGKITERRVARGHTACIQATAHPAGSPCSSWVNVAVNSPSPCDCPTATSIEHWLAQLSASRRELDRFVEETLGQTEALANQLDERRHQLAASRQRLRQARSQQEAQWQEQHAALADQRHRLREEVRREAAAALAQLADALAQQRQQMALERAQWHQELQQMRHLLERIAQGPGSS